MPSTYTQEQIEEAKRIFQEVFYLKEIFTYPHGIEPFEYYFQHIKVILAALEAAEKERDEQWERIQKEFEPLRTTLENADDEILLLSHKITDMGKEYSEYEDLQRVRMITILHTIGGSVEGRPTIELNYLQRLRELVRIEAYATALEKAGDAMMERVWGSMEWDDMSVIWDAVRKEKP